jgi:protocatechuate 3,4-dioxygenase beta subunit
VAGAQADDRGQYRLYGLKPGEYYIRAVDEFVPPMMNAGSADEWELRESLGSQYAPVYYPGVTQMGQAEAVPLSPGEEAQLDFTMRRTKMVEISGRVTGIDGKPTSDAYVSLDEASETDYSFGHSASPDEKGEFKLRGVPPGAYWLSAEQRSSGLNDSRYHARQKIEVGNDNIDSIILALGRGIRVSGRINVMGGTVHIERLFVDLMSREDDVPGGWARVKKDGSFEMMDVPEGNFTFNISGLEEGWYVKSARMGSDDILADGLQIEKGQGGGAIQVVVSNSSAQLEGSVKKDGIALVGARVRLKPDPETAFNRLRARSTSTDQSGRFAFTGVAPGQYRVLAKSSVNEGAAPVIAESQLVNLSEHDYKTIELTVIPLQPQ